MAALVEAEELAGYLQRDLDRYTAEYAIAGASSMVRDYLGWPVTRQTEVMTLDGSGSTVQTLPTLRINDVLHVAVNSYTITDYSWSRDGQLHRHARWPDTLRGVVVDIDHGYDIEDVPAAIKIVVCALAARHVMNPEQLRSETVGETARTFLIESIGREMTKLELALLDAYRIS